MRFVTTEPFLVLWEMPDKSAQILHVRFNAERSPIYGNGFAIFHGPRALLFWGSNARTGRWCPPPMTPF
jgi:hypothetical protein